MTVKRSKCTGWVGERMKVQVRYFAAFREAAGTDSEELETAAKSAAELFDECSARHPDLQKYASSLVAINDEMVQWSSVLKENDAVLFFPPVAGG